MVNEIKKGRRGDREATADELLGAIFSLLLILVPLILLVLFPDNEVVVRAFGGGRIFLVWAATFFLVWLFRKKFDRIVARIVSILRGSGPK